MRSSIPCHVLLRLLIIPVVILSLSGCQKISELLSEVTPESRFLSSLNAHWKDTNNASVSVDSTDGKIAVIDANGEMYVLTPTGKFDSSKKMLPVKMSIIPKIENTQDVVAETLVRYVPETFKHSATSQTGCADANPIDVSTTFNFKII